MTNLVFPQFGEFPSPLQEVLRPLVKCTYNWKLFWILMSSTIVLGSVATAFLVIGNKEPVPYYLVAGIIGLMIVAVSVPHRLQKNCREDRAAYKLAIETTRESKIDVTDESFFRRVTSAFRTLRLQRRLERDLAQSRLRRRRDAAAGVVNLLL